MNFGYFKLSKLSVYITEFSEESFSLQIWTLVSMDQSSANILARLTDVMSSSTIHVSMYKQLTWVIDFDLKRVHLHGPISKCRTFVMHTCTWRQLQFERVALVVLAPYLTSRKKREEHWPSVSRLHGKTWRMFVIRWVGRPCTGMHLWCETGDLDCTSCIHSSLRAPWKVHSPAATAAWRSRTRFKLVGTKQVLNLSTNTSFPKSPHMEVIWQSWVLLWNCLQFKFLFRLTLILGNNGDIQKFVIGARCVLLVSKNFKYIAIKPFRTGSCFQVTSNSRVAVITGTTGQAIFVHLACSLIGCSAVAVNGWSTVGKLSDAL